MNVYHSCPAWICSQLARPCCSTAFDAGIRAADGSCAALSVVGCGLQCMRQSCMGKALPHCTLSDPVHMPGWYYLQRSGPPVVRE